MLLVVSLGSVIYVNDIDVWLSNLISKFADDTKIANSVLIDEDRLSPQKDLHAISVHSQRWQMPFSIEKCRFFKLE